MNVGIGAYLLSNKYYFSQKQLLKCYNLCILQNHKKHYQMNVEQLIKGGHTVQGENKRHYVPLYPQRSNVGNDATMTKPTMFLAEQAALLLRPSNPLWGLKMNVNNATVAQNIVLQARDEFNSEMSKKDAEIAALKAQLKGTAAKPKKKATSTTIDTEMEVQSIENAITQEV